MTLRFVFSSGLACGSNFHSLLQSASSHEEIAPVPEPDIAPGKVPEPQTKSGCTIS